MTDIASVLRDFQSRLPIPLGWRLVHSHAFCPACSALTYRGTDRRLWISADEFMRLEADLQSSDPAVRRKASIWAEYIDRDEDRTLHRDAVAAAGFVERFREVGIEAEAVYAEIVAAPESLTNAHAEMWCEFLIRLLPCLLELGDISRPAAGLQLLGFDINHPDDQHSAIRNPGLDRVQPEFVQHLNEHCLFRNQETATRFLADANAIDYGVLPFCVLGVWRIGGEESDPIGAGDREAL